MKILIAPDKFKGSLTAREVCDATRSGLHAIDPSLQIETVPLADGGEGTCDLLTALDQGGKVQVSVFDPLMREIPAHYGLSADGQTAFIEMANASGLQLLRPEERNCMIASSYGTGQLIRHAIDRGAQKIIIGIGGSATTDGGLGMAVALGYRLLSHSNEELKGNGENLIQLSRIDDTGIFSPLRQTKFIVLCDVDNPLYGEHGAARVFAKQKGASEEDIEKLDEGLRNFSRVASVLSKQVHFPGAGAAGGMGAGARLFLNAQVQKGTTFIFEFLQLESKVANADLVITGEGKIDRQTLSGKVVKGVAELAKKYDKPLIVVAGRNTLNEDQIKAIGISQLIVLTDGETPTAQAMAEAGAILKEKIAAWFQRNGCLF